jgi:hypothetical protein
VRKNANGKKGVLNMVFVFGVGLVTGVALSSIVLLAIFLHWAARIDRAVDPESALIWQETESKSMSWWSDVHQNEHGSRRIDDTASAVANA